MAYFFLLSDFTEIVSWQTNQQKIAWPISSFFLPRSYSTDYQPGGGEGLFQELREFARLHGKSYISSGQATWAGTVGKRAYSSYQLFRNLALGGGGWSATRSGFFIPGKDPVPLYMRLGEPRGQPARHEKSRTYRYSIPDDPARSESK
jgi:hypothetical protein